MVEKRQNKWLPFHCYKSATTCQIDSDKVSDSDQCNYLKTEIIGSAGAPQSSHKRGTIILDTLLLMMENHQENNMAFIFFLPGIMSFAVRYIFNHRNKIKKQPLNIGNKVKVFRLS